MICASFAARAAAGEAANGLLHKLGMDYLYGALHGTAIRYAAEKRYLAESIAELREIANGQDDILARGRHHGRLVVRQPGYPCRAGVDRCRHADLGRRRGEAARLC